MLATGFAITSSPIIFLNCKDYIPESFANYSRLTIWVIGKLVYFHNLQC